jgi:TonB family protein
MRTARWRSWLVVAAVTVVSAMPAAGQAPSAEPTIVPLEWARPVYPQIAQSARVQGDVEVGIDVRADGVVQAVEIVRGAPLLTQASLNAARAMRFTCRDCGASEHRYSLYVTFRLEGSLAHPTPLVVSPTQGWVTVVAPATNLLINGGPGPIDPDSRGIKCLFLWRCDPPPRRARAARCLWLWHCGYYYTYL